MGWDNWDEVQMTAVMFHQQYLYQNNQRGKDLNSDRVKQLPVDNMGTGLSLYTQLTPFSSHRHLAT